MADTLCGYPVSSGYFGKVSGEWILFAAEEEYYDYMRSDENV